MRILKVLAVAAAFGLAALPSSALDIQGIDLRWGYVYTFNEYEGQGSEGVPLDTYAGLALPVRFSAVPITFGLAVDALYREYLVTSDGPVVPTQIETGAAAGVGVGGALGLFIASPVALSLRPIDTLEISLGLSPTVVLRLPINSIEGDTSEMRAYFADRFFFPETFLTVIYDFSETWSFGFSGRWLIPAFNWWLSTSLPFTDQMMVGGHLSIRLRFD